MKRYKFEAYTVGNRDRTSVNLIGVKLPLGIALHTKRVKECRESLNVKVVVRY